MADLLGEDFGLVQSDKLYRCLDKLVAQKDALFTFLRQRWQALFDVRFEVLLYDLTNTYFECDVPETGKRKFRPPDLAPRRYANPGVAQSA